MRFQPSRTIAIAGVDSTTRSLALWLASLGWNIALVSDSEEKLSSAASEAQGAVSSTNSGKVITETADLANPASLTSALDWCVHQFGTKLDVLYFNVAATVESNILDLAPQTLERDLRVSTVGTLAAGQWFSKNARTDRTQGELSLFLVGGSFNERPFSAAEAAFKALARQFAQALPAAAKIVVGVPVVAGKRQFKADEIVQRLLKPFFVEREMVGEDGAGWLVERVLE
ncbi:hypothetical protein BDW74DRAFT_160690 [Aspergillus multicolor]|uniref:uncharacterized protein n=1 Tax=Aspergillus multicolor TaxID=41759 RepID=UPI003CCD0F29